MIPLPPLQLDFGSSASGASHLDANGSIYHASGDGDWNINIAGSGTSQQTASSMPSVASALGLGNAAAGLSPLMLVALALGAVWMLKR
jgi:hypothetical protein